MFTKTKNQKIITKTILTALLVFVSLFSYPVSIYAQSMSLGSAGSLAGSLNISGIGAVALQCASTNFGGSSPFGNILGGKAGDVASGALSQTADSATEDTVLSELVLGEDNLFAADTTGADTTDAISGAIPSVGGIGAQSVPISVKEDSKEAEKIQEASEKQTTKEECLDRIAQWAAITVMDKMTLLTLDWINSGFEGKPFYVENTEQFLYDLATKEILGFSATFSADESLYPFGKTIVTTVLGSLQQTFQQNMISSLNAVLAHGTQAEWQYDFSVGGWAGYTAFVEPNNNIFGAYIESSADLQRRLQGTYTSKALNVQAELQQNLGFLSQKKCMQTKNGGEYIPENSVRHIQSSFPITSVDQIPSNVYFFLTSCEGTWDTDGDGQNDSSGECIGSNNTLAIEIAEDYRQRSICTNWKTVTPGYQIADSLTRAVANPQDQLLLVDEFNENLGLILDALMLQLVNHGVAWFTEDNEQSAIVQQVNGENPGQQPNNLEFIESINGTAEGSTEEFGGLIPMQQEYITQIQTLIDLKTQIFQKTLDLDYCVPGPNPLWQPNASNAITQTFNNLPAYELYPQASWLSVTPTMFLPAVSVLTTFSSTENQNTLAGYRNQIYSDLIFYYTGLSGSDFDPGIEERDSQALPMLFDAFSDYAGFINQRFTSANDLTGNIRSLAYSLFLDLGELNQSVVQYQASLEIAQQTLSDLIDLREEYAEIEHEYILEWLDSAVNQQGITTLADNLATFQSFSSSQITYIGSGQQNSSYHNAVNALTSELGYVVTPPTSYPGYSQILEQMVDIIPNAAFQSHLDAVENEITDALETLGNPSDSDSVIGMIYSCIQQVNQPGFPGYEERLPYPFTLSTEIPGLLSLPTTDTFLTGVGVIHSNESSPNNITVPMIPSGDIDDSINDAYSVETLEERFININYDLY